MIHDHSRGTDTIINAMIIVFSLSLSLFVAEIPTLSLSFPIKSYSLVCMLYQYSSMRNEIGGFDDAAPIWLLMVT